MKRRNFIGRLLGGLAFVAARKIPDVPMPRVVDSGLFIPRGQLPPKEIRSRTNLTLQLRDGRLIPGWYDSTGIWYGIGLSTPIDREVVAWRIREWHS